jgi:hypothetical protein
MKVTAGGPRVRVTLHRRRHVHRHRDAVPDTGVRLSSRSTPSTPRSRKNPTDSPNWNNLPNAARDVQFARSAMRTALEAGT